MKNFFRNMKFMFVASAISQTLGLLSLPLMANWYSAESFGKYLYFSLLVTFLSAFSTLKVEWSIPNALSTEDSNKLAVAGILLATIIIGSVTLLASATEPLSTTVLGPLKADKPTLIIALTSILLCIRPVINSIYIRANDLRPVSLFVICQSTMHIILALVFSKNNFEGPGLIYSFFLSNLIAMFFLLRGFHKKTDLLMSPPTASLLIKVIKKYRSQISSSTGVGLLNFGSQNALAIVLSSRFGAADIGIFYLAHRIVMTPCSLINSGMANAFWGEISIRLEKSKRDALKFYFKCSAILSVLAIVIFLSMYKLSGLLYLFIDAKKWSGINDVILALLPAGAATLIFSPTNHFIVYNKQYYQLFSELLLVLSAGGSFWWAAKHDYGLIQTVTLLSIITALCYLLRFILHVYANLTFNIGRSKD